MSRTAIVNGAAVLLALAGSVLAAGRPRPVSRDAPAETLVDATGTAIPPGPFERIASGSTVADRLLVDLCPADRVVAHTAASASRPDAARYAGAEARIASIDDVETIAALRPDLILVHNVADRRRVERLRDAGLTVFDLGPLEGLGTLREDARQVAALCGAPERGAAYVARLERRMASIAGHVAPEARRSAIYLSVYGDRLFGGTVGTSYHDVLEAAGLRDAAARRHRGWPQYTVEQILELDPDVVVTREGMRETLCAHPVLARLRACPADVVEIDGDLLDAPGPGMLDAAEAVHRAAVR